jgi:hypothetical protein
MTDPRVAAFARELLLPTYAAMAAMPRLARDFTVHVYRDAVDDPIHAMLVTALADQIRTDRARSTADLGDARIDIGPILLLEEIEAARRPAPLGGRYVSAPACRSTRAGDVVASPFVLYQMQFDGELHGFHQRYSALSEIPLEKVTRAMIVNHMLTSVSFFRTHAMSPTRPW